MDILEVFRIASGPEDTTQLGENPMVPWSSQWPTLVGEGSKLQELTHPLLFHQRSQWPWWVSAG